jgi:TolB-like protein
MSSIIQGFEYDIFISYRQKDNKYDGWVTEFVDNLRRELEATFKEPISVYFDINPRDGLLETHDVGASVREKLRCVVFIPIISQTYCDPDSFAWQNEFCAFNRMASADRFGREIRIASGNVASRILPVRIHELDREDNALLESETGGVFRSVEFIYRSPGVNRPLSAKEDHPQDNLNKTYYRDQINKVANAIKDILYGIKKPGNQAAPEPVLLHEREFHDTGRTGQSIIVLPFENMSPDPEQDYLSDGMTEEIITDLSQVPDMLVISRSSAMTFRGARKKVSEIAGEVNVQYVLQGSVRKAGEDLRISVQLIDAVNDTHLWANKYSGKINDIFTIQDKVSGSVVEALKMKLRPVEKKQTSNLKAYDLYLLGRYYWNKRTEKGLIASIDYFEKAISLDNEYAPAYSGLADACYVAAEWNYVPYEEGYNKAREFASQALLLDNRIADSYATLGGIADNFEWDYPKAESLYKAALSLNPNYATAYQWYADFLARMGLFSEAITYINKALQLDPLSAVKNYAAGLIYYLAEDHDNAIARFRESERLEPEFPMIRFQVFLSLFQKGLPEEAADEYQKILDSGRENSSQKIRVRDIYKEGGTNGFLDFIIDQELKKPDFSIRNLAIFYSLSGNKDKALEFLEENVKVFFTEYQYLKVEPAYKILRAEPKFKELVRKIGYTD